MSLKQRFSPIFCNKLSLPQNRGGIPVRTANRTAKGVGRQYPDETKTKISDDDDDAKQKRTSNPAFHKLTFAAQLTPLNIAKYTNAQTNKRYKIFSKRIDPRSSIPLDLSRSFSLKFKLRLYFATIFCFVS